MQCHTSAPPLPSTGAARLQRDTAGQRGELGCATPSSARGERAVCGVRGGDGAATCVRRCPRGARPRGRGCSQQHRLGTPGSRRGAAWALRSLRGRAALCSAMGTAADRVAPPAPPHGSCGAAAPTRGAAVPITAPRSRTGGMKQRRRPFGDGRTAPWRGSVPPSPPSPPGPIAPRLRSRRTVLSSAEPLLPVGAPRRAPPGAQRCRSLRWVWPGGVPGGRRGVSLFAEPRLRSLPARNRHRKAEVGVGARLKEWGVPKGGR